MAEAGSTPRVLRFGVFEVDLGATNLIISVFNEVSEHIEFILQAVFRLGRNVDAVVGKNPPPDDRKPSSAGRTLKAAAKVPEEKFEAFIRQT
jgi:hypothetical protein